ncbi:MAG: hypothetical protein ACOX2L_09810 [Anaerolineae bacterium]|jgi:hypothetical protein|nr:hypothetical protein [Chloroflexota bacterium]
MPLQRVLKTLFLILLTIVALAGCSNKGSAGAPGSATILFTSEVHGETDPCG